MRFAALLAIGLAAAAQESSERQVEKVAAGYTYTQGPAWSPAGFLYFSDIPSGRILEFIPGKGTAVYRDKSNGAAGMAVDSQERLYICETHARRVTRTDRKGKVDVLAERFEGKRLNSPADIAVRKDFNVYFTDPAFGTADDHRELSFYGVYRIAPKGALEAIARPKGRPIGIALSPNGRVLYVSNADERNIRAYDLDKAGAASNERVLVSNIDGIPAGLRTGENGDIYVAARSIFIYSPEGKQVKAIPLAETPSNVAFGDPDLATLYVTARTSLYRIRLDAKGSVQN